MRQAYTIIETCCQTERVDPPESGMEVSEENKVQGTVADAHAQAKAVHENPTCLATLESTACHRLRFRAPSLLQFRGIS